MIYLIGVAVVMKDLLNFFRYAGPGSALVLNVFPTVFDLSTTFGLYLSTNRSIAYVFIDARGSSGDGQKLKHQVFRQLGNLEIRDQVNNNKKKNYVTTLHVPFPQNLSKRDEKLL